MGDFAPDLLIGASSFGVPSNRFVSVTTAWRGLVGPLQLHAVGRFVGTLDQKPKNASSDSQSVQGTEGNNGSANGATGTMKLPFRASASPACPKCTWA